MSAVITILYPSSVIAAGGWTLNADSSYSDIADFLGSRTRGILNDAQYAVITGGSAILSLGFSPRTLYGTLTELRFHVRAKLNDYISGASRNLVVSKGGGTTIGDISITLSPAAAEGPFIDYTLVSATDPDTGQAWTVSALSGSPGFRLSWVTLNGGLRVSHFSVEPYGPHGDIPGSGRWHKGPHKREHVFIDSLSGIPYHKSDLIKVRDPRHAHFGRYVHRDDYDEINPDPTTPDFTEGELDAETE